MIPDKFLEVVEKHEEYFQGVFDGDGTYGIKGSPIIDLATSPGTDYSDFINRLKLLPTLATKDKREFGSYYKMATNSLYMIRFAPSSLKHLPKKIKAYDIAKQLDFFIQSAHNSIRPDKVYKLIKIIDRITKKDYGEYRSCVPIQRELRDIAIKMGLREEAKLLKKRYPVEERKYQSFTPKWVESLCSKEEAWDFFIKKENLVFKKGKNKLINTDFSEGIPIDLRF